MPFGISEGLLVGGLVGGSALFGGLNNRAKTATPIYTADQSSVQGSLADLLKKRLQNPGNDPAINAAHVSSAEGVNSSYAGLADRLQQSAATRGFGRSGKTAQNQFQLGTARAGTMAGLDTSFENLQLNQENNLIGQSQQFGFADPGTKSSGNVAAGALGGGLQTAALLMGLNGML